MNVMSLAAQITLNSKQFENALGSAEGSIASLVKRVVGAQAVIKGLELGFDAINKVVRGGIDAYADYEQLVGGVDTLFKSASQKVQGYAKEAYKTAGLSANEYMKTVTSFSASLLQGLKGDTDQAADVANLAIIDMADNANKMGTDMQSIQNAYMGFAKGNFTMLDNLKLGYGGTKKEMVRLMNDSGVLEKKIKSIDEVTFDQMIQAIHAIQKELGITGTTAEEAATTIQGSKASLYSAFQNLLTLTTDGTDREGIKAAQDAFVSSFAAYFNDNLAPAIVRGLNGSEEVFTAIAKALLTVPESALGDTADAFLHSGTGLLESLTSVTGWLFDQLTGVLTNTKVTGEDAQKFGTALGTFVGNLANEGIKHLPDTIEGLFNFGVHLSAGIIEGLVSGLFGGADPVQKALNDIEDEQAESVVKANQDSAKAMGMIDWLDELIAKYGDAASNMPEWKQAMQGLIDLSGDYFYFFDSETNKLNTSTDAMRTRTKEMRNMQIEEAKMRALGEKRQLVLDLGAQLEETKFTKKQAEYQMGAAVDMAAEGINEWMKKNGFSGTVSSDMTNGQLAQVFTDIMSENRYRKTGERFNSALETDTLAYFLAGRKETDKATLESIIAMTEILNESSDAQVEEIAGLTEEYEKQKKTIEDSEEKIKTLSSSLETAQLSLSLAESALDRWAASLGYSGAVASVYSNFGERQQIGNVGVRRMKGHATGLDRVPFDGYIAQLHRDEAVLTSAEASEWRKGSRGSADYTQLANVIAVAVQAGMSKVGFYFDKEQVASAITPAISENILDGMAAWGYSV